MTIRAIPGLLLAIATLAAGSAEDEQSRATLWAIRRPEANREAPATPMAKANPEVMALAMDTQSGPPRLVYKTGHAELWARPLENGAWAVALFNRGQTNTQVDVVWKELGIKGSPRVSDLWKRQDRGKVHGGFAEKLPPGGSALFRVVP
jgi:alpha-galactosidase